MMIAMMQAYFAHKGFTGMDAVEVNAITAIRV
jgi:hypothetical protein